MSADYFPEDPRFEARAREANVAARRLIYGLARRWLEEDGAEPGGEADVELFVHPALAGPTAALAEFAWDMFPGTTIDEVIEAFIGQAEHALFRLARMRPPGLLLADMTERLAVDPANDGEPQ